MEAPRPLPCYPCPHGSACCSYGTTLSEDEAAMIGRDHGPHLIYLNRWGEWRTRVRQGKCVFLKDNACRLYHTAHYPAVCRGFPWIDAATGGPYQFDQTICPELSRKQEAGRRKQ